MVYSMTEKLVVAVIMTVVLGAGTFYIATATARIGAMATARLEQAAK